MELFHYTKNLFWEITFFLVIIVIYLQLIIRKEKITLGIFDENILKIILPGNIENLRRTKDIIFFSAIFTAILASSGPQWGIEYREKPGFFANVAIVIDTSLSMSAKDIKPSRLENVKLALKSLVENLSGYRVALIAFQDKAYIQCPLTDDTEAVAYFIDILSPNMLPYPGTNIQDAILLSTDYLSQYNGEKNVILFTDGENHSRNIEEAIEKAKKSSIKFITVGIGTPEGDLIYDEDTKDYKKDLSGKPVITKLDELTLMKIAKQTQGKYIRYTTPEFVSSEILKSLNKTKASSTLEKTTTYHNRFQYFLILSFILFLIEFIIMEGLWSDSGLNKFFMVILILSISTNIYSQSISSEFIAEKGNKLYRKKEYEKAKEYYEKALKKNPDNDKIRFNLGNSLYKTQDYEKAIENYSKIKDRKILSKAFYNLANSYYMKKEIEVAKDYYKKAIIMDPSNEDAKYNLELLLKQSNSKTSNKDDKDKNKKNKENEDKKRENKNKNQPQKSNNSSNSEEDQKKEQEKKQRQKQAEQFLEMMKNQEKQNLRKIQTKPQKQQEIKNEFDW